MTSQVYSPADNVVRIGGYELIGVTSIQINRGQDGFKNIDGIDPIYSARVKNFRRPFKLIVKLLQTSDSNSVLQYLHTSSEVTLNSFLRIEVENKSKTHIASTGYIQSAPDLTLTEDTTDREWTFIVNAFDYSGLTDIIA